TSQHCAADASQRARRACKGVARRFLRRGIARGVLMGLLGEYAITPDVFDPACYSSLELCPVYLQHLKEALLSDGLVRDLCDGKWSKLFASSGRSWHQHGKELLKKLFEQSRILIHPRCGPMHPVQDSEWCQEALATHARTPLTGVVVTEG